MLYSCQLNASEWIYLLHRRVSGTSWNLEASRGCGEWEVAYLSVQSLWISSPPYSIYTTFRKSRNTCTQKVGDFLTWSTEPFAITFLPIGTDSTWNCQEYQKVVTQVLPSGNHFLFGEACASLFLWYNYWQQKNTTETSKIGMIEKYKWHATPRRYLPTLQYNYVPILFAEAV